MSTMRILDIQQRAREIGRLRLGATQGGRPVSLETWRFTSTNAEFIEWCAATYGGEAKPWKAPAGDAWEVITESSTIEVAIPSWSDPVSTSYELWSGAGCQRRCDGVTESLSGKSCLCNPDDRECRPTMRASFVLPSSPFMGVVRLESHGWSAAMELPQIIDGLSVARERGVNLRATLSIERKKSGGKQWVVPALDVRISLDQLEAGDLPTASRQIEAPQAKQIEAPAAETISQQQARRLFALAREKYGDEGEAKLRSIIGDRSTKDVTVDELDDIVKALGE